MTTEEKTRRTDRNQETVIEKGIQLLERGGIAFAARYLERHDVPIDVALRVLTRPKNRRNSARKD